MVQKPSICFVALNAYNVLSGRKDINHIGGAEVQQVRIASWLVQKGYKVSFVTLDHGQRGGIEVERIKVFKAYVKEKGIQGLRFFHPRWSGLWVALGRANTDVYYQRGPECETGQVALWCYLHRRKFIFGAANALSCDPKLLAQAPLRERLFYRIGIGLANAITAQTETQKELFQRKMGVQATLVRSVADVPNSEILCDDFSINCAGLLRVLWIGRISKVKRFEWLLDVAESCSDVIFEVVGAPGDNSEYVSSLMKRAIRTPNLRMHGYIPYSKILRYYQRCHILCCASPYEGFPNTFLEAWRIGMPIVSTFDPDGVIAEKSLGWVAHNVEGLVACLRKVIQYPEIWSKASKAARQHYLTNHTPEVCLPEFERLLLRVTGFENHPS